LDPEPPPPAQPQSQSQPAEARQSSEDPKRLAGLAASGLASVAIGLLVRARRRR